MKQVLDKVIDEGMNGSAEVQIMMRGQLFAGAIRRGLSGEYELLTVGSTQDRQPLMIKIYINPEAVDAVMVPAPEEAPPSPVRPKGSSIVIPGMS